MIIRKMSSSLRYNYIYYFKQLWKKYGSSFIKTGDIGNIFHNSYNDIIYYVLSTVEIKEYFAYTYVYYPLNNGNFDLVIEFCKYIPYIEYNINLKERYDNMLLNAIKECNVECVKFILNKYKNCSITSNLIYTTIKYGNYNIFRYLESVYIIEKLDIEYMIELCVQNTHLYILQYLINQGYDNYDNILLYSIYYGNMKIGSFAINN